MTVARATADAAASGEGWAEAACRGVLIAVAALTLVLPPGAPPGQANGTAPAQSATANSSSSPATARAAIAPRTPLMAQWGWERPSRDARLLVDWIAHSRDNADADFVVIDKKFARVHVFSADARRRASSQILIGSAVGDDSVPGIGSRPVQEVRPDERTTPAGRFVAQRGRNALGEDVVWVDYDAAVSMHRVRATDPRERRLQRLATATIADNRISYGCINVPVAFFEHFVAPVFTTRKALVYVLPEIRPIEQVFGIQQLATLSLDRQV
jgi:hypothetical protein